jgi:hypothetical protein
MLFRTGDNLNKGVLDFIDNSQELTLYSAYIKTDQIKKLNKDGKLSRIIVRWEIKDLHQGSSDLDLYYYCVDNRIALYRNTRIHLKCLRNNEGDVFLGSANFTARGIGEVSPSCNLELNALCRNISFVDAVYLDKIISQSQYLTEELFQRIKSIMDGLEEYRSQEEDYKNHELISRKDEVDSYLISDLPMFKNVATLYKSAHNFEELDVLQKKCITHDLATYDVDINQSEEEFYHELMRVFNSNLFVRGLKDVVKNDRRQSMNYGSIIQWIRINTKTVPTPISWELKEQQIVNILFDWICYFDSDFTVERPGYSEVLYYRKNYQV